MADGIAMEIFSIKAVKHHLHIEFAEKVRKGDGLLWA
jgi:hypothetical protein